MLQITIPPLRGFDNVTNEFVYGGKAQVLHLEHSLVSLSKWESLHEKPFLVKGDKSTNESIDYIRCMTLTQNVDPEVYSPSRLTGDILDKISAYIDAPMTATTFAKDNNQKPNRDIFTAEIIYYLMIKFEIPFECQKWHLNRLLTLIRVCDLKQGPEKKMSKAEVMKQQRALNAARRQNYHTAG